MSSSDKADRKQPLDSSPFLASVGAELIDRREGSATIALDISDKHLRTRGIAHGGVIATLLDTAMGVAVSTRTPDGYFAVTSQLNVNFIRPGWDGERLLITGDISHTGKTTAVARAEVLTNDGARVAIGSATFSFVRNPKPGSDRFERNPRN